MLKTMLFKKSINTKITSHYNLYKFVFIISVIYEWTNIVHYFLKLGVCKSARASPACQFVENLNFLYSSYVVGTYTQGWSSSTISFGGSNVSLGPKRNDAIDNRIFASLHCTLCLTVQNLPLLHSFKYHQHHYIKNKHKLLWLLCFYCSWSC